MKPGKCYLLGLICGVSLLTFSLGGSGCKKDEDCNATIIVVDSLGRAVDNASVSVHPPAGAVKGTIDAKKMVKSGTSGSDGKVYLTFQYEAVLQIDAVAGSQKGTELIRLAKGETVEQKVIIK